MCIRIVLALSAALVLNDVRAHAGVLVDLDNSTAGIQDTITIVSGGIVNGSVVFDGADSFDAFAIKLEHNGLNLLGDFKAGSIATPSAGFDFIDGFDIANSEVSPGDALTLGPGGEVGIFSLDDVLFNPAPFPNSDGAVLVTFQLQGFNNSSVDVKRQVSIDDLFTVFNLGIDPLSLTFTGGTVTILGSRINVIPEPSSMLIWSLATLGLVSPFRRKR